MYILGFLSLLYLTVPHLIFAAGWLTPLAGVLYSAPILVLIWSAVRSLKRELHARSTKDLRILRQCLPASLLLLAWLALSGIGGAGYQNADYTASNSLFKDLITRSWPPQYDSSAISPHLPGRRMPLVYYVAYYLPAATVGKAFGWVAANVCLFVWSYVGVVLALGWALILTEAPVTRRSCGLLVLIFIFFSGMDWLGMYFAGKTPRFGDHLEWWAQIFQFSSHSTQLFWVPQHAIAPWIATGSLVATSRAPDHFLRFVLVLPAACLLWSPFATVGLIPVLAMSCLLAWRSGKLRLLISPMSIVTVTIIGVVQVFYFLSSRFAFPKGFIFNVRAGFSIEILILFWVLEFGLLAILCGRRSVPADLRAWALLSVGSLMIIPIYRMGVVNDFAMRSSIPTLYILCMIAIAVLLNKNGVNNVRKFAIAVILAIGSLTAVSEIVRGVRSYHFGPPPMDSVESLLELKGRDIAQRTGSSDSLFFRFLARH